MGRSQLQRSALLFLEPRCTTKCTQSCVLNVRMPFVLPSDLFMLARRRAGCQLVLCLEISIDDATTTASFVTSCWLATPREGQGVTGERQRHSHQPQPCRAVAGLAERPSTTSHRGAVACTTRSSGRSRPPRRYPLSGAAAGGGPRSPSAARDRALERGRLSRRLRVCARPSRGAATSR